MPGNILYTHPPKTKHHVSPFLPLNQSTLKPQRISTSLRSSKRKILVLSGENDYGYSDSKKINVETLQKYIDEGFTVVFEIEKKDPQSFSESRPQSHFYLINQNGIQKFTPNPANRGKSDKYVEEDTYQQSPSNKTLEQIIEEAYLDTKQKTKIATQKELETLNKTLANLLNCAVDDFLLVKKLINRQREAIYSHEIVTQEFSAIEYPYRSEVPKPFVKKRFSQKNAEEFVKYKFYESFSHNPREIFGKNITQDSKDYSTNLGSTLIKVAHDSEIDFHALKFLRDTQLPALNNRGNLRFEKYKPKPDRLVFYLDDPEKLELDGEFVTIDGKTPSLNKRGNLRAFFDKCRREMAEIQSKSPKEKEQYYVTDFPVLLINWSKFSPQQKLALNSMIDAERKFAGESLPENIRIISLASAVSVDESFASRHHETITSILDTNISHPEVPGYSSELLQIKKNRERNHQLPKKTNKISLANCRDWKEAIFGKITRHEDSSISWQKSDLLQLLEREAQSEYFPLQFTNIPNDFDSAAFEEELGKILCSKRFSSKGFDLTFKPQVKFFIDSPGAKLDFELPSQVITTNQFFDASEPERHLINSQIFEQIFSQTKTLPNGYYFEDIGLIDAVRSKPESDRILKLFINTPLDDSQWLRLVSKASELKVKLDLKLASGVKIPRRYSQEHEYVMSETDLLRVCIKDETRIAETIAQKPNIRNFREEFERLAEEETRKIYPGFDQNTTEDDQQWSKFDENYKIFELQKMEELYRGYFAQIVITSPNSEEQLFPEIYPERKLTLNLTKKDGGALAETKVKKVFISSSAIDPLIWGTFLTESLTHGFNSIELTLASGVRLPEFLKTKIAPNIGIVREETQQEIANPKKPEVKIIVTNNSDAALQTVTDKIYATIGAEDFAIEELFGLHGERTALQKALSEGKKIALKGNFTPELLQMLQPIFFDENYKNLILVVEDPEIVQQGYNHPLKWLGENSCEIFRAPEAGAHANLAMERVREYDKLDENSLTLSENFWRARVDLFRQNLEQNQLLRLMGPSGVGKSSLIRELEREAQYEIFRGFPDSLDEWSQIEENGKTKILFIDESNIEDFHFTFFSPLKKPFQSEQEKRGFFFKGKFYEVGKNQKIVFACNQAQYGGGRFEQKLFEGQSVTTINLQDFPASYIYEKILKTSLYQGNVRKLVSEAEFKELCRGLISEYKKENKADSQNNSATVRRLQENVMKSILEKAKEKGLLRSSGANEIVTETYLSTQSTKPLEKALIDSLDIRHLQREKILPHGMGLNAVIFEGRSGAGKSEMIRAVLRHKAITVIESENPSAHEERVCYKIEASWPRDKKEKIIKQAYSEGNLVWIDEINSCLEDGLEKTLNAALTGDNPDGSANGKPGFMLISSINSANMEGRSEISPALLQRSVKIDVLSPKDYKIKDLQDIVKQWLLEANGRKKRDAQILKGFHGEENSVARKMLTAGYPTATWEASYFTTDEVPSGLGDGDIGDEMSKIIGERQKKLSANHPSADKYFLSDEFIETYSLSIAKLIRASSVANLRFFKENLVELTEYYACDYYPLIEENKHVRDQEDKGYTAKPITEFGAGGIGVVGQSTGQDVLPTVRKRKHVQNQVVNTAKPITEFGAGGIEIDEQLTRQDSPTLERDQHLQNQDETTTAGGIGVAEQLTRQDLPMARKRKHVRNQVVNTAKPITEFGAGGIEIDGQLTRKGVPLYEITTEIETENFFKKPQVNEALQGKTTALVKPSNKKIRNPQFHATTTNEAILQKGTNFEIIVQQALNDSRNESQLTDQEAGAIILIAIANHGIGNNRTLLREKISELFPAIISTVKNLQNLESCAIKFSRLFQEKVDQQEIFTGNKDANNLAGMRLKRLHPEFAQTFLDPRIYQQLVEELQIPQIMQKDSEYPSQTIEPRSGKAVQAQRIERSNIGIVY